MRKITFVFLIITFSISSAVASYFSNGKNYTQINSPNNREALLLEDSATVEVWMYPTELYRINENYYQFVSGMIELRLFPIENNNNFGINFILYLETKEFDTLTVENAVPPAKWSHIAATYDGISMKLYLNGNLIGEKNVPGKIYPNALGISYASLYGGLLYDLRLWDLCRSQSEIKDDMYKTLNGNEPGLKGYWPFIIANENSTPDLTSNRNDFRIINYHSDYVDPPYFSSAIPTTSMEEGRSNLNISTDFLDLGDVEKHTIGIAEFQMFNNGNKYIYGRIKLENPRNAMDTYNDSLYIFFIDPMDTINHKVGLIPKVKGEISNSFIFDKGNFDNLGLSLPFRINSVRENGIDINHVDMWVNKDGSFAYNKEYWRLDGLEWPKDGQKFVVYASGIWIGAKIAEQVHTSAMAYRSQFAPGNIVNGQQANPDNERFHVYKIQIGDDNSNPDYANWPADLGAPVHPDGSPKHMGDQTLFVVCNDLDSLTRNNTYYDSQPLGAEVQQTFWGWNSKEDLENAVFLQAKLINKSNSLWEDAYFGIWVDADVGYYGNDLVGIDTVRNMGFGYNGESSDKSFSDSPPPAVGFKILKGVFYSQPVQSFSYYGPNLLPSEVYGEPYNGVEFYNYLQGLTKNGEHYINPQTGQETSFPLAGDPESQSGWVDSQPADRRFLLSTGPFNLAPGESKEIIAAIIVAQGSDNLNSVTVLKQTADIVQAKFDNGEIMGSAVENVVVQNVPPNSRDTLNDIYNSGAELQVNSGESGVSVELASFNGAPPATETMESSAIHGVGNYFDIQTSGDIEWPVKIKIYYTKDDLENANVGENELKGLYYWNSTKQKWILYSNSGEDDLERGHSSTGVDTTNVSVNENEFEGFVWAEAYHLTAMCIGTSVDSTLLDIDQENDNKINNFHLSQNHPNPFNPITKIEYSIPRTMYISLTIFNPLGQKVRTLINQKQTPGQHTVVWDGKDDNGRNVASGIYLYRLKTKDFVQTKKMILLK